MINILKKIMQNKNISIYKLSKLTGLDDKGLGCIINGKTKNPRINTLIKIAKALDLNEYEFAELCDYKVNKQSCIPLDIRDENLKCNGGDPSLGEWITGACPKCKLDVQLGMNYCSNCGQRLLWNEEE